MDIHQLKSFKTIVEKGNFQDAAKALNYSVSAISYQIQQLEFELKFQLFEKIGRRMFPTEQGLKLIPHIRKIEEEIEKIRLIQSADNQISGTLQISVSDSLLTYIIQPVLQEFIALAPEVELKLKVKNCYEIQKEIIKNEVDLGIHYQVDGYDAQIKVTALKQFKAGIMASPNYPEKERDFDQINQYKSASLINNDPYGIYQGMFKDYLKEKNIIISRHIELWSIEAIKKSVMSNLGIACLPYFVVEEELQKGDIIAVPIRDFNPSITMITAYHHKKWISPAMQLFLAILDQKIS